MNFRLLFVVGLLLVSPFFASAVYVEDATNITYTTNLAQTAKTGYWIHTDYDLTIGNITKTATASCTTGYVLSVNGSVIDSASFSGNVAVINHNITAGDYQIVCDNGGASYTARYRNIGDYSYPIVGINLRYTASIWGSGANDTGNVFSLASITSEQIASPPAGVSTSEVKVLDLYDNATLSGLNVTFSNGKSNLTDGSGIALCYDCNGNLSYNVSGGSNYFDGSGTTVENSTVTTYLYGARVDVTAINILNASLYNFSLFPDQAAWNNATTTGTASLLLKPNAQNNVSIMVYDGNYTYNSTQQTYRNLTWLLNTTGQDTGSYQISGLFQALMTVNVSIGTTNSYVANHTTNTTGNLNYSRFTSTFNAEFPVMWNNYSLVADPAGYSLSYKNVSIGAYNFTYFVTIPAYALNSFYLNLYDEITQAYISETMIVEIISELAANNYTTSNGSISFEGLTPSGYTIRYRSLTNNYTERDYYQTLVNQNYYDIDLYGLSSDDSTPAIITVQDTSSNPVEGAIVQLLRYYVSCNCYAVVEMATSGANGQAYFVVDAYDAHYKFTVIYDGLTYFLSTSPENLVPDGGLVERFITINLGSPYFTSYRSFLGASTSLVYNNQTKALSFSWSDPSGVITSGCLNAEYLDGINYVAVTPSCVNASSGSVFLILNNTERTYRYYSLLETNTTYSEYAYTGFIDQIRTAWFGTNAFGSVMASVMILTGSLLFSFSAVAVVIVSLLGVIAAYAMGFFTAGLGFVVGFVTIVAGVALFIMRR